MSTTDSADEVPEYPCEYAGCDQRYPQDQAVNGSFCSTVCYYAHRGTAALAKIRADHRFCATCFSPIKEVEFPSERWEERKASKLDLALDTGAEFDGDANQLVLDATDCPGRVQPTSADAVIGEQHTTEHTTLATDIQVEDRDWRRHYHGRWACRCGNIDVSCREDAIAKAEGGRVLLNLLRTLWTLERDGVISSRASKDRLFGAFEDRPGDFEYAVGRALNN